MNGSNQFFIGNINFLQSTKGAAHVRKICTRQPIIYIYKKKKSRKLRRLSPLNSIKGAQRKRVVKKRLQLLHHLSPKSMYTRFVQDSQLSIQKKIRENYGVQAIKLYRSCPKEETSKKRKSLAPPSSVSIVLKISLFSLKIHPMSQVGIIFNTATVRMQPPNPLEK